MPSPTESVKASVMPGTTTKSDDQFNYASVRLALGLLLCNFDDAVKEGDGCADPWMLENGHTNFSCSSSP